MKQSWTQTLSTTVTAIVLVVLGILALSQATNRIETVNLPSRPNLLASPLQFETPTASMNSQAEAMQAIEVSVAELRNDFLAFEQVRETLSTVGRNVTAGDLAANILAHAEDVFNEAYARSGAALGMNEALSEHLRDFENSLREGTASQAAFATLAAEYDAALADSEIILHHATGEDMVLLLETFHEDLHAGQNHEVILQDLNALHTALMRQYEGEAGRTRGFNDLSEHLHDVRETLQAGEDVVENQLEALYQEMDAFFNAG